MKQILYEQLPPELFALVERMTNEIADLKRMIQEGEIGVAISEAEFNLVKGKVTELEEQMISVKQSIENLSIDPEAINNLVSQMGSVTSQMETLASFDKNVTATTNAALNRLLAIETKHLTLSLRDLVIPTTATSNINLPETDEYLTTIVWSSSNPAVISQTGIVNKPSATEGNMNVVLTASATYGSAESTKTFIVTVPAAGMTDAERLDVVADTFDYSIFSGSETEDGVYIVTDQNLPTTVDGVLVTWSSSNEGVMTNEGVITRSPDGNETVFLTATLTFNGTSVTKSFTVIVEQAEVVIPDPIDYVSMVNDFSVIPDTNTLSVSTMFGVINTDVLTTETLDAKITAMSMQEISDAHAIEISFDGTVLGQFNVTGNDLNEGKLLSDILGQDPVLLSKHVSNDTDLWTITFESLSEAKEIKVELMVDGMTIKEAIVIIPFEETVVEPEPEPEPTEPPTEPEPTEPVEPEVTEPTPEPTDPETTP